MKPDPSSAEILALTDISDGRTEIPEVRKNIASAAGQVYFLSLGAHICDAAAREIVYHGRGERILTDMPWILLNV